MALGVPPSIMDSGKFGGELSEDAVVNRLRERNVVGDAQVGLEALNGFAGEGLRPIDAGIRCRVPCAWAS